MLIAGSSGGGGLLEWDQHFTPNLNHLMRVGGLLEVFLPLISVAPAFLHFSAFCARGPLGRGEGGVPASRLLSSLSPT